MDSSGQPFTVLAMAEPAAIEDPVVSAASPMALTLGRSVDAKVMLIVLNQP